MGSSFVRALRPLGSASSGRDAGSAARSPLGPRGQRPPRLAVDGQPDEVADERPGRQRKDRKDDSTVALVIPAHTGDCNDDGEDEGPLEG